MTIQDAKLTGTTYNVSKLLSAGTTNYKTAKNEGKTFIMYLAAGMQNSLKINICSGASIGCLASCLETAGRGVMQPVKNARLNKSEYYVTSKHAFLTQLAFEIMSKIKYYRNKDTTLYFRLNGTSDVDFLGQIKKNLGIDFLTYDNVVFYDYTKILGKARKYKDAANYVHTFSRSEDNEGKCFEALNEGINVAMVFAGELPKTYKGYKVVSGDKTDLEMLKYNGVILGLSAKGKAKKDASGFVIQNY